MKKLIVGLLLICFFTVTTYAQGGKQRKNIQAQKVAYITQQLELTPEEAEVFWPIYNKFQSDKESINKKYKAPKRMTNMSDAELEQHIQNTFKKDEELLALKKSFFKDMKSKFSIRRVAKLMDAEKSFRKEILETFRERQKERRQRRQNRQGN